MLQIISMVSMTGTLANNDSTSREANIPIACVTHRICALICRINGIFNRNVGGYDPVELFGFIVNRGWVM